MHGCRQSRGGMDTLISISVARVQRGRDASTHYTVRDEGVKQTALPLQHNNFLQQP